VDKDKRFETKTSMMELRKNDIFAWSHFGVRQLHDYGTALLP
jgi:hypothetical protein